MSESIRTVVVSDLSALQELGANWDQLVTGSRSFSPMLSFAWVNAFFQRRVRAGQQWVCVCAYRGDSLCGVLPLVIAPRKQWGLSFHSASYPFDDSTPHGDVIVSGDEDDAVVSALIDSAFTSFPDLQMLRINGIGDYSSVHRALPGSYSCEVTTTGEGSYLPVPSDFDAYRSTLSKNFRSNLNKARNHARRAGTVTFEIDNTSNGRATFLDEFMDIEAANWKGESGSAIKVSSDLSKWYSTLVPGLEASGLLEWQAMRIDDEYVAANMCIRTPRKVFLWKLGYKDAYAKCSPGSLLLQHVIETEAKEGTLDSIELLTSYSWYDNWNMQSRPFQAVTFFRRGTKGRLLFAVSRIRTWLKSFRNGKRERAGRHRSA